MLDFLNHHQNVERLALHLQITFWLLELLVDQQKRPVSFPDELPQIWLALGSLPQSFFINPEEQTFKDSKAESWSLVKQSCEGVTACPVYLHRLHRLKTV